MMHLLERIGNLYKSSQALEETSANPSETRSVFSQDSDDDNMTDEQMFKMDKLLAAVLRTQKEAKDKSKNTKQVAFLKPPTRHLSGLAKPSLTSSWGQRVFLSWTPCPAGHHSQGFLLQKV